MSVFRVSEFVPRTLLRVATPRDPAVTEYVRYRMRAIINSKELGTQDQIAKRMGVSAAYISTLWKTGVGGRSIDGFAKILNFKDADELRATAYDWWRAQSPKLSARIEEPAVTEALVAVRLFHHLVDENQLRAILHRFADPVFDGRDKEYWFKTLMEELKQDDLRAQARKIELLDKHRVDPAARKRQNLFREGHHLRHALEEEQAVKELETPTEPPSEAEAAAPPSRRKREKKKA